MKPGSPDARKIFNSLYMKYVAEYNVANTARELLKRG